MRASAVKVIVVNDLINEWTSDSISDLYSFVPYTWDFTVRITDSAELILPLNDKNWIDTSSSASAENCLAAVVGKEITAEFSFPFVDFCPEKVALKYVIEVRDCLALRVWLPAQSPLAPLLHSLMKNAHFTCSKPAATALPTISSRSHGWEEIWRCERISLMFDYTYHVSYADPPSDLPYHVIASSVAKSPPHPIALVPDDLLIEVHNLLMTSLRVVCAYLIRDVTVLAVADLDEVQNIEKFEEISAPSDLLETSINVEIGESEILLTGILIKLIIDMKNNYFGLYDQLTDVVAANGASHLFGDILYEVEYYRPLALRLCLSLLSSKAHCLVHSAYTDFSFPDKCPVLYLDQLVMEIVKGPLETVVQVNVGTAAAYFEPSQSLTSDSDGVIALETLSFRGHALFSEIDVPWDACSVEYAWLTEIIIGVISGKLHPVQLVVLAQFIESLLLLSMCPDEDLQLPEKYELCHHMNDIRTCPRSALNLIDSKGRIQNCESEENLKYKMVRVSVDSCNMVLVEEKCAMQLSASPVRISHCNCHEGSFCSGLLLKFPSIRVRQFASKSDNEWIECAALCVDRVDIDVRIPYVPNEVHLIQEKRSFLLKHDKVTSRLHFLWSDQNICSCYGGSRFFGSTDITGKALMIDLESALAAEHFDHDPTKQPGIGQSIVYEGKRYEFIHSVLAGLLMMMSTWLAEQATAKKTSSEESFHSALSTSLVNLSHHMVCPILSSSVLLNSYNTFLSRCTLETEGICLYGTETDESLQHCAQRGKLSFVRKSNGVNEMRLVREESKHRSMAPPSLNSSSEKVVLSTPSSESVASIFGADYLALYVRGTLATNIRLFVSPLALEVTQRLGQHAAFALCCIHPAFVVQHLYTVCVFRHHSQPLTVQPQTQKSVGPSVHVNVLLPVVDVALFQCGLIEKTIQSTSLQDTLSHLVRSNIVLCTVQETVLVVSSQYNTFWSLKADEARVRVECNNVHCHAQFLQVVESSKRDFWHNKSASLNYTSNWATVSSDKQLLGYDMRIVAEFDVPDVSLSVNTSPPSSPQRTSGSANNVEMHLGTIQLEFGLCKPVDQTSSKEWPLFDVFAPSVTAWTYATHRLSESADIWLTKIDEWVDLAFAKTLSDALDCNSDQIFSTEKSCFADVKVHQRAAMSCPSCKLSLILVRYAAEADLDEFWAQINLPERAHLASSDVRKQALVVLLSHWQTIICSQIKLADAEVANKYVKEAIQKSGEIKIDIELSAAKNGEPRQHKVATMGSARSVTESRQMDLYHWISARHREHKEAISRSKARKTLDDFGHVNPMEIVLSVFFWTVYEERKLEPSRLDRLPLPQTNAVWSINWKEIRVDVLEPRMISSSSVSYLSMARHHLLHLESILMKGHFHSHIHMDDLKVRPIRASYDIFYSATSQNVRVVFALASVCLFNDLSRVLRSTINTFAYIKSNQTSSHESVAAQKPSSEIVLTSDSNLDTQTSWIARVLDKLRDYRRSRAGMPQVSRGCVQVKAEGHFSLKVVMLEMALTHLFVSTTFKKIQLSHRNQRDKARVDKQVLDELNASVQRANLILSEFVIGSDAKHIVNFSVKASTFNLKREQEMDGCLHSHLNLCVGDVEGDMPIHAQNLHEVVLRNAPQLNEQMTRLEYSEPSPVGEYSPHLQCRQAVAVIHFDIHVSSIELTAQLLPSLKAMYRLEEAQSSGKTGSEAKFMAKLKKHVVYFTVNAPGDERRSSISWDTFTLALPHIHADGAYKTSDRNDTQIHDENLQFREGGYIDIVLTIGRFSSCLTLIFSFEVGMFGKVSDDFLKEVLYRLCLFFFAFHN
ncbi:unnamed protein product [Toxocara canis]|uniref:SHR-BD domain-containing protein n=1 Tax=Toxocara canis TaxID=6265 RepID=A0A183V1G2_TOXCA|nr:unnamed protein product [Toxocara canis]